MEAREARPKDLGARGRAGGAPGGRGRCEKGTNMLNLLYFKDYLFHDFEPNLEVIYL